MQKFPSSSISSWQLFVGCIDMTQNQIFLKSKQMTHSVSITLVHWENCVYKLSPWYLDKRSSVLFNSVTQSCLTLFDPMNHSTPRFPVLYQLPESTQTYVHQVGDAIQPPHPLLSPSPPALNLSQHQGFFQWVSSSHQVAKVLEFQLQHQSFQWIFRTDFL